MPRPVVLFFAISLVVVAAAVFAAVVGHTAEREKCSERPNCQVVTIIPASQAEIEKQVLAEQKPLKGEKK